MARLFVYIPRPEGAAYFSSQGQIRKNWSYCLGDGEIEIWVRSWGHLKITPLSDGRTAVYTPGFPGHIDYGLATNYKIWRSSKGYWDYLIPEEIDQTSDDPVEIGVGDSRSELLYSRARSNRGRSDCRSFEDDLARASDPNQAPIDLVDCPLLEIRDAVLRNPSMPMKSMVEMALGVMTVEEMKVFATNPGLPLALLGGDVSWDDLPKPVRTILGV